MTGMLASVSSLSEARIVFAAGADIIDLKNPSSGALGAVSCKTASEVVRFLSGRCLVSATIGDLPMQVLTVRKAIKQMSKTGVDFIKIGLFDSVLSDDFLKLLDSCYKEGLQIVLVLFADRAPDIDQIFSQLTRTRITGIMLDTAGKQSGRLTDVVDYFYLEKFVRQAKDMDLLSGLAGSLQHLDIERILPLTPDYLGFRGALCQQGQRNNEIDPAAVEQIRSLIPVVESTKLVSSINC